jgi:hypothetical protein
MDLLQAHQAKHGQVRVRGSAHISARRTPERQLLPLLLVWHAAAALKMDACW